MCQRCLCLKHITFYWSKKETLYIAVSVYVYTSTQKADWSARVNHFKKNYYSVAKSGFAMYNLVLG